HRFVQVGDIPATANNPDGFVVLVCDHIATRMKSPYALVGADDSMVVHERLRVAQGIEHRALCCLNISWIDAFDKRLVGSPELTRLKPVDPMKLVGPGDDVERDVPFEAADVRHALCLCQPFFVACQLLLRCTLFRYIERDAQAAVNLALR